MESYPNRGNPLDRTMAVARKRLRRNQTSAVVGTTDTQLLGPNDKREGVWISAPPGNATDLLPNTRLANAVDTSTTGVKLTFTIPAGQQGILYGATQAETTGTTVVTAIELVRAAVVTRLGTLTNVQDFNQIVPLTAADIIRINVITAVALSVCDLALLLTTGPAFGRITISFGAPAVQDVGININPGQGSLLLLYDDIGPAFTEDIHAISASGTPTIGVVDIFRP